ncbi:MAG: sulfatase [Flavobacteriales bacterium]|nr:sulfatase [Flavobacteriales bacterium]
MNNKKYKKLKKYLSFLLLFIFSYCSCQESPNFLWLVCEDQSLFFSMYGDSSANTPNINQLAQDGVVYKNCYTPSPVCAPSRSSLITGMYPTTLGTQHMRAYKKSKKNTINSHNSLPYYNPKPKKPVRFFTEDLRANGYYCTNNSKEDYNMITSPLAWDESSKTAHWRNKKEGQSFFSIFNFNITHESSIWKNKIPYSKHELENIKLPIFFPNDNRIKSDILTNYKNIEKLDKQIGRIINQLKEDSLYENTIIFFLSDHGGPFPRYKRSIHETGIRVPFIVKWVNDTHTKNNNQLISFVDFAPTILDIANIKRDFPFEGVSFYKKDQRRYIYAATDRFDELTDRRRSIRGKNFKLIFNSDTISNFYKPISYRQQMETMQVLDSLQQKKELNNNLSKLFFKNKKSLELYKVSEDYFETTNLIHHPKYERIYKKLEHFLFKWMENSDFGNMSEAAMLDSMFSSYMTIPTLNKPKIIVTDLGYLIESNNQYASVGWRNKNEKIWNIYQKNQLIQTNQDFEVLLFKPGYKTLIQHFEK